MPFPRALAEQEAGQHRRHDHGEDQRAQQRERHRPRHGLEQPAFHALQGEDRQIGGDDDGDGVEDRPLDLVRGLANPLMRSVVPLSSRGAQMADDVLDHHHRAVHHHAEIQRAQRKQIGGNLLQVEANRGEQERKRNRQRDDERAAHVAEKQEENDDHQDDALGQVVQDRVGGEVHQVAAVDEGNDLHALGQNADR